MTVSVASSDVPSAADHAAAPDAARRDIARDGVWDGDDAQPFSQVRPGADITDRGIPSPHDGGDDGAAAWDLSAGPDHATDGDAKGPDACAPNAMYAQMQFSGDGRLRRIDALDYPGLLARGVTVWLPDGYAADDDARYPVLFIQDGQNVFEDSQAAFGVSWNLDETVDQLTQMGAIDPHIVVAIDHTPERMADYTPTADPGYGGGNGDTYADFVALALKPLIDASFRTRCSPEDTTVMGSSLGGLIALHIGYRHGDRFGRIGAVSPSLWWNLEQPLATYGAWNASVLPHRVWIDGGGAEGKDPDVPGLSGMVSRTRQLRDALLSHGMSFPTNLGYLEETRAGHNEGAWRARLPAMLGYLLANSDAALDGSTATTYVDTFGAYTSPSMSAYATLQWRQGVLRLSPPTTEVTWSASEGVVIMPDGRIVFGSEQLASVSGAYNGSEASRTLGAVTGQGAVALALRVSVPPGTPTGLAPRLVGNLAETGQWDAAFGRDAEHVGGPLWEVRAVVASSEQLLYKWTLGSWESVEKGEGGVELTNRIIPVYEFPLTVAWDVVVAWASIP